MQLFREEPVRVRGDLRKIVKDMQAKKARILRIARKHTSPFYLIDDEALEQSIGDFSEAFRTHLPDCAPHYAVKANHHPHILRAVLRRGYGLDVSSGRELQLALDCGAKRILFSGPGKTEDELLLAIRNAEKVIINIDSFGELQRLGKLAQAQKVTVRAGVRIFAKAHSSWSKFGIPLGDLKRFWLTARRKKYIDLRGIHFHLSWNRNAGKYVAMLDELGAYLRKEFTPAMLAEVHFIDFGGGFYPDRMEGYYPWTAHYPGMAPTGAVAKMANTFYGEETRFTDRYYLSVSDPLHRFAREIARAIRRNIRPIIPHCAYYTEPGRIICTKAMHIVLRIADIKTPQAIITDGGVNITGWEYGEYFYYPLINLSHPAAKEIPCTVYGSLCTPHDIWGYACYAKKMTEGDVILVPNQGAYRFALAQQFIKPIPETHILWG